MTEWFEFDCPSCGAPVQMPRSWCEACGYSLDNLRPEDIY
jgi:uncharacterized OB-fold protein